MKQLSGADSMLKQRIPHEIPNPIQKSRGSLRVPCTVRSSTGRSTGYVSLSLSTHWRRRITATHTEAAKSAVTKAIQHATGTSHTDQGMAAPDGRPE